MTRPLLLAALLAAAAAAAAAAPAAPAPAAASPTARGGDDAEGEADVGFTPVTIRVEGELLDTRFADMDGDGRNDLVTAVLARRPGLPARREIRIHALAADGSFPLQPTHVITVPDDVIVYGFADVRDEPGRELLLLTRSGIHTLSPQIEGLRENLRRLATRDLLYQVPSSRSLSSWSYVLERPGAHDLLLVPGAEGLSVWGPAAGAGGGGTNGGSGGGGSGSGSGSGAGATGGAAPGDDYAPLAELGGGGGDGGFSVKSPGAVQVSGLGIRGSVDSGRNRGLFLEDAPAAYAALLQAEMHTDAPALADVDGDGQKDIVFFDGKTLRIHLAKAGFASTPSRVESVPDWLDPGDGGLLLHLRDLDGDGDVDAYARVAPKEGGIEHGTFTYFVMRNDGSRIFPEQPQQVLRFEGNGTDSELTDVDGDGRLDLVVTKYELPSLTDLAGGFKLTRSALVYFASDGDEPFERKPAIKDEQLFTIDSLQDALVDRHISGDFSGDGLADLVEVDLTGRVVIRRVTSEHHFFGGDEWKVEETPWKRLDLGSSLKGLQLQDVNGDGLGDLINPGTDSLTLLLSHRTGGGR